MATLPVSDTRKNTVTLGSSSAGPINVGFRLFSTDIRVFVDDEETTAFTLTATFEDGFEDDATITFDSAQDAGAKIDIISDYQPERSEDYLASDPQLAQKLNIELGQLWGRVADANRDIARAPLIPVDASTLDLHLPNPISGATLVGRSDGKGWDTGPTSDEISNAQTYATNASDSADAAATSASDAADSASLFPTLVADRFIQAAADGLSWVSRTAAQVRTALGLSDTDSPTFAGATFTDDLTIPDKIIHAGDTDTAIRFPAANTVTMETNGGERVRVNADGDVSFDTDGFYFDRSLGRTGFGLSSPETAVHIQNGGASGKTFSNSAGLIVENNGSVSAYYAMQVSTAGENNAFNIQNNGNVSVGKASATTRLDVDGPIRCASYTVATVPSASSGLRGAIIYVTDEAGGQVHAFCDSTNWRRVTDRSIIST